MQALYGPDGADAIGRAYRAGLLGEGNEAKALLDLARKVSNLYWRAYATGTYQCALADRTHGSVADLNHERIKRGEEWLAESLAIVARMGIRSTFDQLVIDVNPDSGPDFLDRLIWAKTRGIPAKLEDSAKLREALDGLAAIG
jgi:hypothetical protein